MDYQFLKIENHGEHVQVLTISAPKTLNALNSAVLREMNHFVDNVAGDLRALVITGDGPKSFVAGADISEMATLTGDEGYEFGKLGADVFRKIETLPFPVIAAVNGFALGGGCELAMACDIRIASAKARFGQPEVGLGITPGFSGTVRLPRLVGWGYAKEMIFTGKVIRADEALRVGLVNAVYEPEDLMPQALELAQNIAAKAPIAVAKAKQSINRGYDLDAQDAIELEKRLFAECFDTEDQKEGMAAFLEKRPVTFQNK